MAKKSVAKKSTQSDTNVPMTRREIIRTVARKKTKSAAKKRASKQAVKSKKAGTKSKRG